MKMNRKEIEDWCDIHVKMKSRVFDGLGMNYAVIFENGEKYEYREKELPYHEKIVEIYINNELVNKTKYRYENFGWLEIA